MAKNGSKRLIFCVEVINSKGLVKKYGEGWAVAVGNVVDKKHMAHPLPPAQKSLTHP